MAPIQLQAHSCQYCQNLVIDDTAELGGGGEENNYFHLGCLATYLLEEEWIHRSDIHRNAKEDTQDDSTAGPELKSEEADGSKLQRVLREALLRQESILPKVGQTRTLRRLIEERTEVTSGLKSLKSLHLACFFVDSLQVKFFALWDGPRKQMAYRTRSGFSVYASPDNPAGRMISTRPIEEEACSKVTFTRMAGHMNECLYGQRRGKKTHVQCPLPALGYMPSRLLEITSQENSFKVRLRDTSGMAAAPYVALSYCWGGDQIMKSTRSQLDNWKRGIPWDDLPQTLKDAVTVCHWLNFRLLNSILTIAASRARSVQEGFLNDRVATMHPDQVFQLPFKGRYFSDGAITLFRTDIEPEPLDTRGWALQERLLSPRTYEFSTRQSRFIRQHNTRGVADGWRVKPEEHGSRQDNLNDVAVLQTQFIGAQQPKGTILGTEFDEAMENWYRVVKVYSHRNLTLSTDRIMAISGIAARYGHIYGDEYCAGLWRSTLSRSLFWNTKYSDKDTYPRPTTWQGPSWSWVSLNWPVDFPSADETDEEELQVLHIDLQLANIADPYGALLQGSGRLTMKGKIHSAYLMLNKSPFGGWQAQAGGIAMNGKGAGNVFYTKMTYDAVDETDKERAENNAALLELSTKRTKQIWWSKGLVVRCTRGDSFVRIGTYKTTVKRQSTESDEVWEDRLEHEYNWFNRLQPQIVDII